MSWTMTKKPHSLGGIQKLYKFSNGLVVSAIKTDFLASISFVIA